MKNFIFLSAASSLAICGAIASGCGSSTSPAGTGAKTTTSSSTSTSSSTTTTSSSSGTGGTSTSSSTSTTSSSTSTTSSSSGGNPTPPAIGATQIDRMGRPAINTALNHAFDPACVAPTLCAAKDTYNADSNAAMWATNYTPEIAKNLGILDSLDANCGNQLLAAAGAPSATTYNTLAGTLAGDMLWLNTAGTTLTQYLAVEANATGVKTNTDQGGRALTYDVIDTTYSALAIGALTGVGDGVNANDVAFLATFPYEAAPH